LVYSDFGYMDVLARPGDSAMTNCEMIAFTDILMIVSCATICGIFLLVEFVTS
jgi:hypothetical protein